MLHTEIELTDEHLMAISGGYGYDEGRRAHEEHDRRDFDEYRNFHGRGYGWNDEDDERPRWHPWRWF